MILVRAPMRISLFGGGTDYLQYINEYGGISVGFAINQYSYVGSRILPPYFNYKSRISYNEIECVQNNKYIKHLAIRNVIEYLNKQEDSLEIFHYSDCPSYTGLGTSSSFIVALLKSLADFEWKNEDLINATFHVEKKLMGKNVGIQDATLAVIGNIGGFRFKYRDEYETNPIEVKYRFFPGNIEQFFNNNGLLFFTGISRNSSDVVSKYVNTLVDSEHQHKIRDIAEEAYPKLLDGCVDLDEISSWLDKSWRAKRQIPGVLTPELILLEQELYDMYRQVNAFKILGGGGGGSVFILSEPQFHEEIIVRLKKRGCIHIPYQISSGAERIL